MKRSVTVQIGGQRYTLKSDADEEAVRKVAAHVDLRLRELQKQTRSADTQSQSVLTALQIAEELFKERAAHAALKKRVREKGQTLLTLLKREARI